MNRQAHIVRRQIYELTLGSSDGAHDIQQRLSRVNREAVAPVLMEAMASIGTGEGVLLIDRLEIDIGTLSTAQIEDQLPARIEDHIATALAETASDVRRTEPDSAAGRHIPSERTVIELLRSFLITGSLPWWAPVGARGPADTLLLGALDSAAGDLAEMARSLDHDKVARRIAKQASSSTIDRIIDLLAGTSNVELRRWRSDWTACLSRIAADGAWPEPTGVAVAEATIVALLGDELEPTAVSERILRHACHTRGVDAGELVERLRRVASRRLDPDRPLRRWLHAQGDPLLRPDARRPDQRDGGLPAEKNEPGPLVAGFDPDTPRLDETGGNIARPGGRTGEGKMSTGELAQGSPKNPDVARQGSSPPATDAPETAATPVSNPRPDTRPVEAGSPQGATGESSRENAILRDSGLGVPRRTDLAQRGRDRGRDMVVEPAIDPQVGALVENAGLVIAWPFLPRFFEQLGLVQDESFVSSRARERAVLLLQYLVAGEPQIPEHQLTLNKLLCGWPFEEPVAGHLEVTAREEDEIADLCSSILEHWRALGTTSPEGLRGSFLAREGLLSREQLGWNLKIERKGYDVLLDQLPWGIGFVMLPWMDDPLVVEW